MNDLPLTRILFYVIKIALQDFFDSLIYWYHAHKLTGSYIKRSKEELFVNKYEANLILLIKYLKLVIILLYRGLKKESKYVLKYSRKNNLTISYFFTNGSRAA